VVECENQTRLTEDARQYLRLCYGTRLVNHENLSNGLGEVLSMLFKCTVRSRTDDLGVAQEHSDHIGQSPVHRLHCIFGLVLCNLSTCVAGRLLVGRLQTLRLVPDRVDRDE
jgi:hypothetical protein